MSSDADSQKSALHKGLDGSGAGGQHEQQQGGPLSSGPLLPAPASRQQEPSTAAVPTGPVVRLVNVSKTLGKQRVLDHVTLDFTRGQITVVVGPSGTGKTVLLKHIIGLLRPDHGEVWFDGQQINQLSEAQLVNVRMKIGYLFQMGALFDSMTVEQNICFPLTEHTTLNPHQCALRCRRMLEMVGLAGIEAKMPAKLSGGQRKRVALARAIILEPQVVLYDEPTTGLDPIRGDIINELIINLSKRLGITSLVVTHDMVSANKIADRLVMLYDGKIIADGDPETFSRTPHEYVQRFIRGQAGQDELERVGGV